jgi:CheY-like chemotaxis protein
MRLLIVEDEAASVSFLRRGLGEEGYAVDVARDAASAAAVPDRARRGPRPGARPHPARRALGTDPAAVVNSRCARRRAT